MNAASVKKSLQLGPECPNRRRAGAGTPHLSSALEELVGAPQIVTCTGPIGPLGRPGPGNCDTRARHEPKDEEKMHRFKPGAIRPRGGPAF